MTVSSAYMITLEKLMHDGRSLIYNENIDSLEDRWYITEIVVALKSSPGGRHDLMNNFERASSWWKTFEYDSLDMTEPICARFHIYRSFLISTRGFLGEITTALILPLSMLFVQDRPRVRGFKESRVSWVYSTKTRLIFTDDVVLF